MHPKIDYDKIKRLRISRGLKQSELAEKLHIVTSAYNKMENGKRVLRVDQLQTIALALEVQTSELLNEPKSKKEVDDEFELKMRRIEVSVLESSLLVVSSEMEQLVIEIYHEFESKYPLHELNYVDFLANYHPVHNVAYAVEQLKQSVSDYESYHRDPDLWNLDRNKSFMLLFDFEINPTTFFDANPWYSTERYKMLKDKTDDWLRSFALNEENWEFVHAVMSSGMQGCYHTYADRLQAFREMLGTYKHLAVFFVMGFLDDSYFDSLWKDYCIEGYNNDLWVSEKDQKKYDSIRTRMEYLNANKQVSEKIGQTD